MWIAIEHERLRKLGPRGSCDSAFGDQPVEIWARRRRRAELCDRTIAIGHDQPLALFDEAQVTAQMLP